MRNDNDLLLSYHGIFLIEAPAVEISSTPEGNLYSVVRIVSVPNNYSITLFMVTVARL